MITLTDNQQKFFEFVKEAHGDQKRKYTGEPYYSHLLSVAEIVTRFSNNFTPIKVLTALGHDLLEDTDVTEKDLRKELNNLKFDSRGIVEMVVRGISFLTDEYTHENYPELNREVRKKMEAYRLRRVPGWVQSVKYADLIDNTSSIVEHDPNFALIYLQEKKRCLKQLTNGDFDLYCYAIYTLMTAEHKILNDKLKVEE